MISLHCDNHRFKIPNSVRKVGDFFLGHLLLYSVSVYIADFTNLLNIHTLSKVKYVCKQVFGTLI